MDPELRSLLGTAIGYVGVAAATWGVARGLIPETDKATVSNAIAAVIPGLIAVAAAEYKRRTAKPAAIVADAVKADPVAVIAAVNKADNGLKVVAVSSPGAIQTAPLR